MSFGSNKWANWVLDEKASLPILKKAWDLGINFYDTADMYSNGDSEKILGKFIKENNIPREDMVIASKVNFPVDKTGEQRILMMNPALVKPNQMGLSRKHIMESVEQSLERLQTNYIDLYIIHRWDNNTPIEETMKALHDLVQSGKVRYIGASSMWAWQFAKAQHVAEKNGWTKFISMQNLYNLVYREEERDMIPLCIDQGVGLTPYSPLAKGILSRANEYANANEKKETSTRHNSDFIQKTYEAQLTTGDYETLKRVAELANKKGCTPAELSIAWLLHKPGVVSPIFGVTRIESIESNVRAVDIELTPEEVKYLDEQYLAKAVSGISK